MMRLSVVYYVPVACCIIDQLLIDYASVSQRTGGRAKAGVYFVTTEMEEREVVSLLHLLLASFPQVHVPSP